MVKVFCFDLDRVPPALDAINISESCSSGKLFICRLYFELFLTVKLNMLVLVFFVFFFIFLPVCFSPEDKIVVVPGAECEKILKNLNHSILSLLPCCCKTFSFMFNFLLHLRPFIGAQWNMIDWNSAHWNMICSHEVFRIFQLINSRRVHFHPSRSFTDCFVPFKGLDH